MVAVRLVQIGIVAFWVSMTAMHVRTVYFPETSRLAEVEVEEVIGAFLQRRSGSTLSIYERAEEIGRVTVTAKRLPRQSGIDSGVEIWLAGVLDEVEVAGEVLAVRVVSRVWLDSEGRMQFVHLGFRLPQEGVNADVEIWPETGKTVYRVSERGRLVFDSEGGGGEQDALAAKARLLLAAWGIDASGGSTSVPVGDAVDSVLSGAKAWSSRVVIADQEVEAYLLEVPLPMMGEAGLRFVITRFGELERIEGVLGYEIRSAELELVPEDE